jgi:lipopolysaccharide transport system ATP-binding protein
MGEVARSGRTVLFVSHNANAVRALCSRVILLQDGSVHADGVPAAVLARYERESRMVRINAETGIHDTRLRRGSGEVRFTDIAVLDAAGEARHAFRPGETIRFDLTYECRQTVPGLSIGVALRTPDGMHFVTTAVHRLHDGPVAAGTQATAILEFPENLLRPGEYPLYFWLGRSSLEGYDVVDGLLEPLVIFTSRSDAELGYDPANPTGYVSVPSRLTMGGHSSS